MKYILACIASVLFLISCDPQQTTEADKQAVEKDTVDPREGKGEGEVGDRVYGR